MSPEIIRHPVVTHRLVGNRGSFSPYLWRDAAGHFHCLFHSFDKPGRGSSKTVDQLYFPGSHAYSTNGYTWQYSGSAYSNLVEFTDGSTEAMKRRERPHLVLEQNSPLSFRWLLSAFTTLCALPALSALGSRCSLPTSATPPATKIIRFVHRSSTRPIRQRLKSSRWPTAWSLPRMPGISGTGRSRWCSQSQLCSISRAIDTSTTRDEHPTGIPAPPRQFQVPALLGDLVPTRPPLPPAARPPPPPRLGGDRLHWHC